MKLLNSKLVVDARSENPDIDESEDEGEFMAMNVTRGLLANISLAKVEVAVPTLACTLLDSLVSTNVVVPCTPPASNLR